MGTATTIAMMEPDQLGLVRVGKLAEICKHLGYQAAQKKEARVLPLFAAFWADTIEVLEQLIASLDNSAENAEVAENFSQVLQKRLEWLAGHVGADARELGKKFS